MATPVALSSCLLIDPTVEPEPFNAAELIERFEQGKRDDDREMEAVLAEFEELSREFAVWSFAKSQKDDETNSKTLRTTIKELEEEEKKQGERSHEEVGLTEVEVVPDTSLSTLTTLRAPRMPELHRQKISSFLDTFKHAFKVLIG